MVDPDSVVRLSPAQELELNILSEHLDPKMKTRVFLLLLAIDRLQTCKLTLNPYRILNGKTKVPSLLTQLADDIARLCRDTFDALTPEELTLVLGVLETRVVAVGPIGKDSLGRSTRLLMTPKGRIVFG